MSTPALLPADWPAPPGVVAFTTLRHGAGISTPPFDHFNLGARCGDDPDAVASNRAALASLAGLPGAPHWLHQVHGTGVVRFPRDTTPSPASGEAQKPLAPSPACGGGLGWGRAPQARDSADHTNLPDPADAAEPEADAAVTDGPGTVLAILTADCLPVVFAADDGSEVAAAHAGWRGLAAGVLEATVDAMRTPPARLLAWLGPAAGPQAYETGAEVREAFLAHDPAAESAFVATRPGHWRIDLYALARMRLRGAGMAPDAVHGGGLCTIGDPSRFYSHRRDARTGRMATLVWRT